MEPNELLIGNELIAKFTGKFKKFALSDFSDGANMDFNSFVGVRYHKAWDWIMPACKQWNEIPDELNPDQWRHYHYITHALNVSITTFETIEVFKQLVQNIRWYNAEIRPR